MKTKLISFILLVTTACTFQVQVLTTPTPEPTQAILVPPSPTPLVSTDLSATPPPVPTLTATVVSQSQDSSEITFSPGATWHDVIDSLEVGMSKTYTLYALKDQIMSISILTGDASQPGTFQMEIKGQDGTVLCPIENYSCSFWRGVLPASQKYFIKLTTQVSDNFKMHVVIDPPGTTTQSFDYLDPQARFGLSYPDEFAPAHYAAGEVYKFPPELVLQYIDTPQYVSTNLNEAYFLLGFSTDPQAVSTCTQLASLDGPENVVGNVTINGVSFTKSQGTGVGAGNIYETTHYRAAYNGTCYEITYFIHSGNIGNYTPGTVKEFDHDALLQKFDQIVFTLVLK